MMKSKQKKSEFYLDDIEDNVNVNYKDEYAIVQGGSFL